MENNKQDIYITIVGLDYYMGINSIKPKMIFKLKKDYNNDYDDEAIEVTNDLDVTYGYVANSVSTVARGSHSAGYIRHKFDKEINCEIMFVVNNCAIARLII